MASRRTLQHIASQVAGFAVFAGLTIFGLTHQVEVRTLVRGLLGAALPGSPSENPRTTGETPAEVQRTAGDRTMQIKAGSDGHYHADADVNGRSIQVMVDTGASIVALTFEDAERAGIFVRPSDFTHRVSTANGISKVAPVTLDRVQIGEITVRDVRAAVIEAGKLKTTLLGMSFLGRLSRTEMSRGVLILTE